MSGYLLKRLLSIIPVILVVGTVIFILVHLIPGDPAVYILGPEATTQEIAELRIAMGLDEPVLSQYVKWFGRMLRFDLGDSIFLKQPVTQALFQRMEPTLTLTVLALVIAIGIGLPAGVLAAARQGSWWDHTIQTLAPLGLSTPNFWLGLNLAILFGVHLEWLPVAGFKPLSSGIKGSLEFMILPALTLGLSETAIIARMTRATMLEVLRHDYIRTAKAKGLKSRVVIFRHGLRNAMIPILTVIGMTAASLINGAVVTESIFNLPGVGRLFINAIFRRDYPVIQGVVLFTALVYVLINLAVDLAYAWLDPRVKYA